MASSSLRLGAGALHTESSPLLAFDSRPSNPFHAIKTKLDALGHCV